MSERTEVWMRIFVAIISGIVLSVWKWFIMVLLLINWVYTLFAGRRLKELAELSEIWNTQMYTYMRYVTFVTNARPFPFQNLTKNISKFVK